MADQPSGHDNIYLNKHEIFPGYTLHKSVALQK